MSLYADVALPVAVDRTFTYIVPPELQDSVTVGVRVIVPFGSRHGTGIIVGLPDEPTYQNLKPIRDVIDPAPVLNEDILRLSRWISDYYIAPLGEVLKTSLPQGFTPPARRIVSLAPERAPVATRLSPQRAKILQFLAENGPTPVKVLGQRTRTKSLNAILNGMQRNGDVIFEDQVPVPPARGRTTEFIAISDVSPAGLEEVIADLSPRKLKARALLETVSVLHSTGVPEIRPADLVRRAGVSSSVLREYRRSGLLPSVRREVRIDHRLGSEEQTLNITLNEAQQGVLAPICSAIDEQKQQTFLLHGVTGSGKTQVYIEAIRFTLGCSRGAVVLVPEISLTPQIVRRFNSHFPGIVAVVHSRMSPAERFDVWKRTGAGEFRVVIGPRSAVFAPVDRLGLIVVDEEHESSYKQYDSVPRYHARDAALVRAKLTGAVAVLGSATPSMESYHNVETGKYRLLELPSRVDRVPMPAVHILDVREEWKAKRDTGTRNGSPVAAPGSVSGRLKEMIEDRLGRREGIILLQNRRGFAPFVECPECGYHESCDHCSVTLTYHMAKKHLRCHYCGTVYKPHTVCPECGGETLLMRGIGTQRVEEELNAMFPDAKILRMDLDTNSRKGAHERLLQLFGTGKADILLGTQMVAKGLDFPRVTLVGVISADTQMLLPDFRAAERTFQLLTQVAGRAGRSRLSGEVVIQTRQPDHYALSHVVDHDFRAFYDEEIEARRELGYPPFSRMALIEVRGEKEETVRQGAEDIRSLLGAEDASVTFLGPSPAVIAKINQQYRWQIILKSMKSADPAGSGLRERMRGAVSAFHRKKSAGLRVIVDMDPVGLM